MVDQLFNSSERRRARLLLLLSNFGKEGKLAIDPNDEIIKALEEHSSGLYTPSPGVVYPALTYLEEMGFAVSEASGNKKLYSVTETGKEELAKNRPVLEGAKAKSQALATEAAALRQKLIATAARIQSLEREQSSLDEQITQLQAQDDERLRLIVANFMVPAARLRTG